MKRLAILAAAVTVGLSPAATAFARPAVELVAEQDGRFGGPPPGWRREQREAREAVRQGRNVPLGQVLGDIRRRTPGRQLDANREQGPGGRDNYRVRWAADDGRRMDYVVDAETGAIVRVDGN